MDGSVYVPIEPLRNGTWFEWDDTLRHYAVYQLAYAPVRVETGPILASVGQTSQVSARVTNLTDRPVRASIAFRSVIPTLSGEPVKVEIWPNLSTTVNLPLSVGSEADWGRKTAVIEVESEGQKAYLWRQVTLLRPPDLSLARRVTTAHTPVIELVNAPCPWGEAAPALEATVLIGDRRIDVGQIPPGGRLIRRLTTPLPFRPIDPSVSPETAMLQRQAVALECKDDRRTLRSGEEIWLARPVATAKKVPNAIAAVSVFNHHDRQLDQSIVEVTLPKDLASHRAYHLCDGSGATIPAESIAGGTLLFPASAPAQDASSYVLCSGTTAGVSTDLKAKDERTANGTVTVENSFYRVTLDGRAGGCVTELVSKRTGKDYGLQSFGVNYGRFSQYDPRRLPTNTVSYINEDKTSLAKRPCTWKRMDVGSVRVIVEIEVGDGNIVCCTTYEFRAHTPHFRIARRLTFVGKERPEEIVVVDARFRRHALAKSYPCFVGVPNDKTQPHFGWRYGNWVPEVLTLMTPPTFDESLSILVRRKDGLDQVRQGFWPAERPKPGPCEQARIELVARHATFCNVELIVYVHREHQIAAARLSERLRDPPLVVLTLNPLWRPPG
jgi:hypothetical protein